MGGLIHTDPSIGFSCWSKVLTRSFALIEKEVYHKIVGLLLFSNLYLKDFEGSPITKPTLSQLTE